jgi:hypothetical protein
VLLEIKNLKMDFGAGAEALRAVDGVSLTIAKLAREKFRFWRKEAFAPSLQFKELLKDV